MSTEYERRPNFTTESTPAFAYSVTPNSMGEQNDGGSQSGVGPGSTSVGGVPAEEHNPLDHKVDRVDYSQKPMAGAGGGSGDSVPSTVDKSFNVTP